MVVAFNLECTSQAVSDVHDAGIFFSRFDQHVRPFFWQCLEPLDGVLVGAMFTPHDGVNAHFGEIRCATEDGLDLVKLLRTKSHVLGLFEGCWGDGSLHVCGSSWVRREFSGQKYGAPMACSPRFTPFLVIFSTTNPACSWGRG